MQAVLLQDLEAGGLTSVSVKDYLAMRCSQSGRAIVPFLTLTEMEEKPIGDNTSGQDKNYIVDINQNLVLDNKSNLLINENIASAVNLFYSTKVKNKLPSHLENGVIEFRIVNNSRSIKIDGNTIFAKIKMNVSFVEAQGLDTPYILNCNSPEVLKAKDALEKQLTNALMEGYQLSKSSGIDFLGIKNMLHQKYGLSLNDWGFDKADFKVEFDIEVTENS